MYLTLYQLAESVGVPSQKFRTALEIINAPIRTVKRRPQGGGMGRHVIFYHAEDSIAALKQSFSNWFRQQHIDKIQEFALANEEAM